MQQQVANFLARRWSVPPGGLAVDVRPIAGGLESRVARARVADGRHHGREPRRFVVKELSGRHRRESRVYRWLWAEVDTPPAARVLGVESFGENDYLYLEDLRAAHDWPWGDTSLAASVCRELARLHDAAVRPADVFAEWDYGAELERSAEETLESALTARDADGVRYWPHPGGLKRVIASLGAMRARLMEAGTTVIHGDVHPGNVIVEASAGTHRIALIDWGRARIGSPLEDAASWLHSVGCWEPEARRRHDTLLSAYLQARRTQRAFTPELRRAYWFASASNGLSGAICYHLAVLIDPKSSEKAMADSRHALMHWERVIRRAATLLTTSAAR
jgi:aminoglycoside phosphotransferase (APT) family kinase protein